MPCTPDDKPSEADWSLTMQSPQALKVLLEVPMYREILRGVSHTGPQHVAELQTLVRKLVDRCISLEILNRNLLLPKSDLVAAANAFSNATLQTAPAVAECPPPYDDPLM